MKYRGEIDGLRAIAVLAVILNHVSGDLLPSGFLGVDVFFVISGYVITASLYGRDDRGLAEMLLDFYLRRIKRLLPALAVFVAVTALLFSFFSPAPRQSLETGLLSLFGLSNIHLIAVGADYFGDSVQLNPFMHTWSLGVEEQFYLVYPALIWMLGFGAPRSRTRLLLLLAALGVVSLAGFVHLAIAQPLLAYYAMPARFWELTAGACVFWAGLTGGASSRPWTHWAATGALFALLPVLLLPGRFQVTGTVLACALTVVVLACSRPGGASFKLLASRPLVLIGLISYSLYLWHWGLLVLARWTVGLHWWSVPIVLALTFAAAALSYRYVEVPARRATWSTTRAREIGLGLGCAAAVFALVFALADTYEGKLYAGRRPSLVKTGVESLIDPYSVAGTTWAGLRCVLAHNGQVGRRFDVDQCTLGDFGAARKRVLVIGNSFAAAFTESFDELVKQDGYAVTIIAAWGASPVPEVPNHTQMKEANDYYWRSVVPELVSKSRSGDWVVLINDMADLSPAEETPESRRQLAQLQSGLLRMSQALAARGIGLAVLHGNPFLREANCDPSMAASQWFSPAGRPCNFLSKQATLQRRSGLDRVLGELQASAHIAVIDLMDLFCPGSTCDFEASDGTLLYRDIHSHPSVEGARMAAPLLRKVLAERQQP